MRRCGFAGALLTQLFALALIVPSSVTLWVPPSPPMREKDLFLYRDGSFCINALFLLSLHKKITARPCWCAPYIAVSDLLFHCLLYREHITELGGALFLCVELHIAVFYEAGFAYNHVEEWGQDGWEYNADKE